ncbi:MAG: DUF2628 domain-containing protein [Alphaproteobacteria bacterium]|nr:DUF2628 domain-containing protein [Alphaproteobacteria bacterium]
MAKMRIYTIHINPRKKHPYESPIFVAESFNVFAFIFHWIWALSHRMWLATILMLCFWTALNYLNYMQILHPFALMAVQLGYQILIGYQANDLRRARLKKSGYIISDIVTSDNLVRAEQRYFERYFPQGRLPQTPAHTASKNSVATPA